jgi:hypothetical protein
VVGEVGGWFHGRAALTSKASSDSRGRTRSAPK